MNTGCSSLGPGCPCCWRERRQRLGPASGGGHLQSQEVMPSAGLDASGSHHSYTFKEEKHGKRPGRGGLGILLACFVKKGDQLRSVTILQMWKLKQRRGLGRLTSPGRRTGGNLDSDGAPDIIIAGTEAVDGAVYRGGMMDYSRLKALLAHMAAFLSQACSGLCLWRVSWPTRPL